MPEAVPGGGAAGGVGNVLTKKVGPLPVWGYAVALGGGLLALRLIHPGSGSSSAGGVSLASPVPVSSGGAPSGSGADLVPPADTGPRQAPPVADTASPIPIIINNFYPTVKGSVTGDPVVDTHIPSVTTKVPTAPVQPPITNSASTVSSSGVQVLNGVSFQLSPEAIARGGIPAKDIPAQFTGPKAGPMTSPGGPTVSPATSGAPATAVITNGSVPFYTNKAGVLTQGSDPGPN